MYCLVLYVYFQTEGVWSPASSFEFFTDQVDAQYISDKKGEVALARKLHEPQILVHGIFKL